MNGILINHWGGIPRCVQSQVCRFDNSKDGTLLSSYDKDSSFQNMFNTSLIEHLQKEGYYVLVLGVSSMLHKVHVAKAYDVLPDMVSMITNVDYCSPPLLTYEGNSFDHDKRVLQEAEELVQRAPSPFFMIINLLSCRDVDRMRMETNKSPKVNVSTLPVSVIDDPRTIPSCLSSRPLGSLGDSIRKKDQEKHGESNTTSVDEVYYYSLLSATQRYLDRLEPCITTFLDSIPINTEVAITCTHSLAIGEHGIRGGASPTHVCSETIWSTSVNHIPLHEQLEQNMHDFVRHISNSGTIYNCERQLMTCNDMYSRCVLFIQERKYSIVVTRQGELVAVFDADSDVHETDNIVGSCSLLKPQFIQHYKSIKEQNVPSSPQRPRLEVVPSPRPPPITVSSPTESDFTAPQPVSPTPSTLTTISTTSRRPSRKQTTDATALKNLRQKESRLNKMHR